MTSLPKLAELMRKDWDRRVKHDYRFWMSDGYRDDATMWQTGERDFCIISQDLEGGEDRVALEVGCGVGRMLRAAAGRFGRVIGIDVSPEAIAKATEFVGSLRGVQLLVGNGVDLQPVPSQSVDLVWSFAALTSMPTPVIAAYLLEMRRVVKPRGCVRLQVYLGSSAAVSPDDTLHLRCFQRDNFERAVVLAGFECTACTELVLPIQVSFKESGMEAFIVTLAPQEGKLGSAAEIARQLLPEGESHEQGVKPEELEAWMALNYAQSLADEGNEERLQETLKYVETYCKTVLVDTRDTLEKITDRLSDPSGPASASVSVPQVEKVGETINLVDGGFFDLNIAVISRRFPQLAQRLAGACQGEERTVTIRESEEGPVVWCGETCLDHPAKPRRGADAWATRALQDKRLSTAGNVTVVGFGAGYHLESLLSNSPLPLGCLEPSLPVLRKALECRDLRGVLERLAYLGTEPNDSDQGGDERGELLVRPQALALHGKFVEEVKSVFYSKRGLLSLHPKLAVAGPVQGGTGPIAQYTFSALTRLKQRVRGIDMTGFNKGFELADGFVVNDLRRNLLRGSYVEMLSMFIGESLAEKPVDILICMAQAPVTPRLLTELRRKGVITVLWFVEDYLRFTYWREMAQHFDFVFTIQRGECIEAIKKAGAGEVHYLPTACDPLFHAPLNLSQEERSRWGSPISFVGAGYHNRQQMFASLADYPFRIWGSEWPTCRPFDRLVQEESRRIAPEEYIKIFNATDINLNLHSSTERDGVEPYGDFLNPRTFELASCGAFQLVDERSLLRECFDVGSEIITFNDLADLKEKIAYYSVRPDERRAIAARARERVLREHTYEKRLEEMLSVIYASKYETLRRREESGPWAKMLKRSESHEELHNRCQVAFERGEEPTLDALVSDIVTGNGKLSETEQKLLFLFHVRKQIIRMTREEAGTKG